MPLHDWTLVEAGIFHDFHTAWITHLKERLKPVLPRGYYALAEQHLGRKQGDVLALHIGPADLSTPPPEPPGDSAVAVAVAPPSVHRTLVASPRGVRRTLTIRHISGHRIIALVEVLSPANKRSADSIREFADKALGALHSGIHLVIVDLLPPGTHDPQGMHAAIWERLESEAYELPEDKTLTLVSYSAGSAIKAYIEHLAVGDPLKDMPLFLTSERYVTLPLAATYEMAFAGMPDFWRDVLEGRTPEVY
jgi:hypothetical protein